MHGSAAGQVANTSFSHTLRAGEMSEDVGGVSRSWGEGGGTDTDILNTVTGHRATEELAVATSGKPGEEEGALQGRVSRSGGGQRGTDTDISNTEELAIATSGKSGEEESAGGGRPGEMIEDVRGEGSRPGRGGGGAREMRLWYPRLVERGQR
jgi:hypothetical protein